MNIVRLIALSATALAPSACADELPFRDSFQGKLGPGWSWIREDRDHWRIKDNGLEVRIQPGNMWGSANDSKNVLVRPAPKLADGDIEVCVTVQNTPTHQYEQVDLVWYYDDGNMVKLGQELVDGKLKVVMGREEKDKPRTVAIVPLASTTVRLRYLVNAKRIVGQFKLPDDAEWRTVGECDLPAVPDLPAKISLQCYQGPANEEHWARITDFSITVSPIP